jgi:hypothetical protein
MFADSLSVNSLIVLTWRSGAAVQPATIHHNAPGWVMCQTLGVIDIVVDG